jgi:hypothetical protein
VSKNSYLTTFEASAPKRIHLSKIDYGASQATIPLISNIVSFGNYLLKISEEYAR